MSIDRITILFCCVVAVECIVIITCKVLQYYFIFCLEVFFESFVFLNIDWFYLLPARLVKMRTVWCRYGDDIYCQRSMGTCVTSSWRRWMSCTHLFYLLLIYYDSVDNVFFKNFFILMPFLKQHGDGISYTIQEHSSISSFSIFSKPDALVPVAIIRGM